MSFLVFVVRTVKLLARWSECAIGAALALPAAVWCHGEVNMPGTYCPVGSGQPPPDSKVAAVYYGGRRYIMKRILKIAGFVLLGFVGLVLILGIFLAVKGTATINRVYDITLTEVAIPSDADSLARGVYLVNVTCAGCHGDDLSGLPIFDQLPLGFIPAPNITRGTGGVTQNYADSDWVRTIRHGVAPDGTALAIMPARAFWYLSESDLGAVIAYVKTAPAVDNDMGARVMMPIGRILSGAGLFDDLFSVNSIDHSSLAPAAPPAGASVEYGQYLVNIGDCQACHGPELSGAASFEPDGKPGVNLTPGGELIGWDLQDFITMMRTGMTPSGRQVDEAMPWKNFGLLDDPDLEAVFLYLESLPAQDSTAP